MISRDSAGRPTIETSPTTPYERRLVRLVFLPPDIQRAILAGGQHVGSIWLRSCKWKCRWDGLNNARCAAGWIKQPLSDNRQQTPVPALNRACFGD
jgi:hypothetical protein